MRESKREGGKRPQKEGGGLENVELKPRWRGRTSRNKINQINLANYKIDTRLAFADWVGLIKWAKLHRSDVYLIGGTVSAYMRVIKGTPVKRMFEGCRNMHHEHYRKRFCSRGRAMRVA